MAAVKSAIMNKVSLIIGPPGTGKSTSISSIAYNLKSNGKILVSTPSNSAADHLTESLSQAGLNVLRVLSKSHESKISSEVPAYGLCLHVKLENFVIDEEETKAGKARKLEEESERLINEADIIVTTCSSACSEALSGVKTFSTIIIDEACQVKK